MALLNQECLDASLLYTGDIIRTANVLRKAERGEPITLAFLGGSITYGSGVIDNDGTKDDRFSERVQAWFRRQYPNTACHMINAGLPATGTIAGVFRAETDVFVHKPDLVVLEFAVNEADGYNTRETSEALIRAALAQDNAPAVMFLFMALKGGAGWSDPVGKLQLAQHYGVPCISWRDGVRKAFELGIAAKEDFDADGTHPNKDGHAAASECIVHFLKHVRSALDTAPTDPPAMPNAQYTDDFDRVQLLSSKNFEPPSTGVFQTCDTASHFVPFKHGWVATERGEPFSFECEAKRVYLAFQCHPTIDATVKVTVNGIPVATLRSHSQDAARFVSSLIFQSETLRNVRVKIEFLSGNRFELSGFWIACGPHTFIETKGGNLDEIL